MSYFKRFKHGNQVDLEGLGMSLAAFGVALWTLEKLRKMVEPKPCALAYDWWWQ